MKQRIINKKLNKDCLFQLWTTHYKECIIRINNNQEYDEVSNIRRHLDRDLKFYDTCQIYKYSLYKLNIKPKNVKKYFAKYFPL